MLVTTEFQKSKMFLYMHYKYSKNSSNIGKIPELTSKQLSIDMPIKNGIYLFNGKSILPNVFVADSIVSVKNKQSCLMIRNTNHFSVNISQDLFSVNDLHDISHFHILKIPNKQVQNRTISIEASLNLDHCSVSEKNCIQSLCKEFDDCFFLDGDQIDHTNIITHSIQLKADAKPSFVKQYRLPESQKKEIQIQIDKMEKEGIIEKCPASGWNSPLMIVPKKDENGLKIKYRLVVDFRRLNDATVPIQFPIPQIDSIINQLTHSKWFSTLDLRSAFYQIKLDEQSRSLTTFENNNFSYRFLSMPQGLSTSPSRINKLQIYFSPIY